MQSDQFVFWESSIIFTTLHAMFLQCFCNMEAMLYLGFSIEAGNVCSSEWANTTKKNICKVSDCSNFGSVYCHRWHENTIILRQICSLCIKATSVPTGKPAAYRDAVLASKYALGHRSLNPCIKFIWRWDVRIRDTGHITIRWYYFT